MSIVVKKNPSSLAGTPPIHALTTIETALPPEGETGSSLALTAQKIFRPTPARNTGILSLAIRVIPPAKEEKSLPPVVAPEKAPTPVSCKANKTLNFIADRRKFLHPRDLVRFKTPLQDRVQLQSENVIPQSKGTTTKPLDLISFKNLQDRIQIQSEDLILQNKEIPRKPLPASPPAQPQDSSIQRSTARESECTPLTKGVLDEPMTKTASPSYDLSPQRKPPEPPPVGFSNMGCNCWTNALMQMITNTPSLLTAYLEIGKYYEKEGKDAVEKNLGKNLLAAYQSYKDSVEKQQPVASNHTQNIRLFFSHFWPHNFDASPSKQEDANEALMLFMTRYEDVLKLLSKEPKETSDGKPNPAYHDILPSFYFSMTRHKAFKPKGELKDPDPTKQDYSEAKIDPETGHFLSEEPIKDFFIPLRLPKNGVISFNELLSNYFNIPSPEEDEAKYQLPNGKLQTCYTIKNEIKIKNSPLELLLTIERKSFDRKISQFTKITTPVQVPSLLELRPGLYYELSSFVVHEGSSFNSGHYITYKKQGDEWYCCNDSIVSLVTQAQVKQKLQQSYFHHYNQISHEDFVVKKKSCEAVKPQNNSSSKNIGTWDKIRSVFRRLKSSIESTRSSLLSRIRTVFSRVKFFNFDIQCGSQASSTLWSNIGSC